MFFCFFFGHAMWPVGSWFPNQELNLCPWSRRTEFYLLDQIWSFNPKTISALVLYLCSTLEPLLSPELPQPSLQIPGPRVTATDQSPAWEEGSLHIYRHQSFLQAAQPCSCYFHVHSITSPWMLPRVLNAALACVPPWGWTAKSHGARWTFARI